MEINPLSSKQPTPPVTPPTDLTANVEELAKVIEKFKQMIEQIMQNSQLSQDPYHLTVLAQTTIQLNQLSEAAQK